MVQVVSSGASGDRRLAACFIASAKGIGKPTSAHEVCHDPDPDHPTLRLHGPNPQTLNLPSNTD